MTIVNDAVDPSNTTYNINYNQHGKSWNRFSFRKRFESLNLSKIKETMTVAIPKTTVQATAEVINSCTPASFLPLCPATAAINQTQYSISEGSFNHAAESRLPIIAHKLPKEVTESTGKVLSYLAKHTSEISKISLIASAAILPFIGNPILAGAILAPVAYEVLDSYHWIPRNVSIAMEGYIPLITNGVAFIGGGIFGKMVSAANLITNIPTANQYIHKTFDEWASRYLDLEGPTLKEIDAPININRNMTFDEINKILKAEDDAFDISVSSCASPANAAFQLKEDCYFLKFVRLCNGIDWKNNYETLRSKFSDDENFLEILNKKFPEKKITQKNFDIYLDLLSKNEGITPQVLLKRQVTEQMFEFVCILLGERSVDGSKQDLSEAISYCGQILTYLNTLDSNIHHEKIEIEDILMKLAIEGGEYCARGIKRAAREVLDGIYQQNLHKKGEHCNLSDRYELRLLACLQQMRLKIVENFYLKFIEEVMSVVNNAEEAKKIHIKNETTDKQIAAIAQDLDTLDLYRKSIVLGFYPLTNFERNSFSITELIMWGSPLYPFRDMRNHMYQIYKQNLGAAIQEIGEIYFADYLRRIINNNTHMSAEQKKELLEKYTESFYGDKTSHVFHRLIYVMLGILSKKDNYEPIDEWTLLDEEGETTWTML
ncbi:MAG: hypothetical protein VX777_07500 [Chlamydiota bacterium]|nr:hypothetical protein [Chlamydiota bacterium]